MPERVSVRVDGRTLQLSNLDKVLYPAAGYTKGEVIDYYTRVAPVLLPHLAGRPLTVKRYPNGVDGPFFFEKNAARGTPSWVRTATLPVPGSTKDRETIDFVIVEELATLVWLANLAALELHVPQWQLRRAGARPRTDLLVFDLDPGEPATIEQCCEVALLVRDLVGEDGITLYAKTSGQKGMQLAAPVQVAEQELTSAYARWVAQQLESQHADLVVSRMTRSLRRGKVLVDWSQNNPAKTTVAPYSLRAKAQPTVSTPLGWDEVEAGGAISFTAGEVLDRVDEYGDLFAAVLDDANRTRITRSMVTRE
jgi:bifunctional non-homologous end joining protein LigD